jgi:hypothetical protein
MKKLITCRRTFIAFFGLLCLTWLGWSKDMDVSMAIATIAGTLAVANSYEGKSK